MPYPSKGDEMAKRSERTRHAGGPSNGGGSDTGFTLLPMLAGSLVLIAVGMVVVTTLG
jgi:hypothetical protein